MNKEAKPSAILIAGPTASGKSAIALDVAEAFGGVIINADAMQVYRDLHVLTARPSRAEEARVPHRLYGVLDAAEPCSAGRWLELVKPVLEDALQSSGLAIFVGGTGLYFKALTEGIAPVPQIPASVREDARALYETLGGEAFHRELKKLDPDSAAALPTTDRQRLVRAFEVATATGKPLSAWHKLPALPILTGPALCFVLWPDWDELYRRIDARFDQMLEAGAVEEARMLIGRDLSPDLPALKALGVQELGRHFAGDLDLESAAIQAKIATRRYAKRQRTWFKAKMMSWKRINTQEMEKMRHEIFTNICDSGLTPR